MGYLKKSTGQFTRSNNKRKLAKLEKLGKGCMGAEVGVQTQNPR